MSAPVRVVRSVDVAAPIAEVWERVVTPEGINDELHPLLSMRMPARHRGSSIATVPVREPLGRARLCLLGVLPVEYDDLFLLEVVAPHRFHERSSMASARVWEHRRELRPLPGGGTRVTDHLSMEPRLPVPSPIVRRGIAALFGHRHRRLRAHFTRLD